MQLLSQVFSIKMLYRQLITITLSIYKNFSLGRVVIMAYSSVFCGKRSTNGMVVFPKNSNPSPELVWVT